MSAPIKPWEKSKTNNSTQGNSSLGLNSGAGMASCCGPGGGGGGQPPAIPMRPSQQAGGLGAYGGLTGGLTGYGGMSSYGGYGGYSSGMYSPMGGMYGSGLYGNSMYGGGYGLNRIQDNPNSYVRMAEENSRQAFQSIESIVQAFGSVAMMLESTFHAVYNSFRAVIGVADHFSRMKSHFAQIFSALAVIRTLKWLYRKLLVLLRLREAGVSEEVWATAAEATLGATATPDGKLRSSWPIMMFFAVVVGGPWLIWRLLSSLTQASDNIGWANGDDEHFIGEALYDFNSTQQGELRFRQGQRIIMAPKELQPRVRGWLLASVDGKATGLIPANYIKILGKREGRKNLVPSVQPGVAHRPAVSSATSGGSCCKSKASSSSAGTQPHGSQLPASPSQTDEVQNLSFTEDLEANFPDNVGEPATDLGLNAANPLPVTEQSAVDILEDSTRQDT